MSLRRVTLFKMVAMILCDDYDGERVWGIAQSATRKACITLTHYCQKCEVSFSFASAALHCAAAQLSLCALSLFLSFRLECTHSHFSATLSSKPPDQRKLPEPLFTIIHWPSDIKQQRHNTPILLSTRN